ncbi:ComF family protein [Neolewinella aurantiaca]|uniref:ComF family protein n=1 Tax=Neolewinella aurantiaca TaxID=2602767 RepID=A0A5C7FNZ5_9BACT|nr:phosphoribosyltransferase family protein [Neolewinella aurantiaca]TXF87679.1 ComF family protein [Neolewinella aurantiaca]
MSIKRTFHTLGDGLMTLLFPRLCLNCQRAVVAGQRPQLCIPCNNDLALTNHWLMPENGVTDRMVGRLPVTFGAALLAFNTGTVCQQLIHALKYYHRPEVGVQLGEQLAELIKDHPALQDLDGIVPVPIHPNRRHERGYNQAEKIAEGMATVLRKPVYPKALKRVVFKGSQTKRTRYERVENTRESFGTGEGDFAGKHLLLVDDVLTTGATVDFCGNILLASHEGLKLGVATLAIAE